MADPAINYLMLVMAASVSLIVGAALSYLLALLKQNKQRHQFELEQSRFSSEQTHLNQQVSQIRQQCAALQQQNESLSQKQHQAQSQVDSAKVELRSQQNVMAELRQRLTTGEQQLEKERQAGQALQQQLADEGKKSESLNTLATEAQQRVTELKSQLAEQQESHNKLQDSYQQLNQRYTALDTSLEKREQHFKEQLEQLSENKKVMSQEFENLANKIFEEKGLKFSAANKTSIDEMLTPFKQQIEGFQKRVNDVHSESIKGNTSLSAEIQKVLDIGSQMSSEANNLTSALKGDSQQRGAWGEAQLRRTLEMSGLVEETHFEVQSSFKDDQGNTKQTDYLIKLPDGKHIIIDSKVSLIAYDKAVAAESEQAYQQAMSEHDKSVKRHVDDLAFKDYTNVIGMHSPSFVLMFMPIEPAYIEALKNNKDLFEYGYQKNIVLVSHTTLVPILRTVSNLWMMERSNVEAREISERAGEIFNQVCTVAERLDGLGKSLNAVSNHYNKTVTAISGKQGLYGKVDRFNQLSTKVSKSLPQLESVEKDFDTEKLTFIAEAIEELSETE